mmetsp:Transcript_123010/g.282065  ORF Transcript_123010/g.282065 Transcript_123010/m.282065 type:complete len:210 (+) Transcript_123010:1052-1681(+)
MRLPRWSGSPSTLGPLWTLDGRRRVPPRMPGALWPRRSVANSRRGALGARRPTTLRPRRVAGRRLRLVVTSTLGTGPLRRARRCRCGGTCPGAAGPVAAQRSSRFGRTVKPLHVRHGNACGRTHCTGTRGPRSSRWHMVQCTTLAQPKIVNNTVLTQFEWVPFHRACSGQSRAGTRSPSTARPRPLGGQRNFAQPRPNVPCTLRSIPLW